jgi:myo-inositol-1(or 4)-monophosphatase
VSRPVDVDTLRDLAVDVATRAGELLLNHRPRGPIDAGTKSSPTDLVTVMDTKSETEIRSWIREARPDDTVLGEEGGEEDGASDICWVVDPIDGTVNYRYHLPHWSVSVAVEVQRVPTVGVVVDPSYGETWVGMRGAGATCNGEPVACSSETRLEQALFATGFAYDASLRARQAEVLQAVLPRVRDIRRFGSAAIDLCWTAAGRYDGYFERGPQRWDWTAGALIAREAGVQVGGLHGQPESPRFVLAAPPPLFVAMHDLLAPLRPDED